MSKLQAHTCMHLYVLETDESIWCSGAGAASRRRARRVLRGTPALQADSRRSATGCKVHVCVMIQYLCNTANEESHRTTALLCTEAAQFAADREKPVRFELLRGGLSDTPEIFEMY